MKPHKFHHAAEAEFLSAQEHYAAIDPALGQRYYHAVEQLLAEIREAPARFRLFDPPLRRHFREGFPYALVFLDRADYVWIIAVMHFKQRPGYWKERLTD